MTSDVAATEAVVAKEIARLRMKERENNVILPPNRTTIARVDFPRPARRFPDLSWRFALPSSRHRRYVGSRQNMGATRNLLN
jgi:hypothetical protein